MSVRTVKVRVAFNRFLWAMVGWHAAAATFAMIAGQRFFLINLIVALAGVWVASPIPEPAEVEATVEERTP